MQEKEIINAKEELINLYLLVKLRKKEEVNEIKNKKTNYHLIV